MDGARVWRVGFGVAPKQSSSKHRHVV